MSEQQKDNTESVEMVVKEQKKVAASAAEEQHQNPPTAATEVEAAAKKGVGKSIKAKAQEGKVSLELEELEGVGPTTARNLRNLAGISDIMSLATANLGQLTEEANLNRETAAQYIAAAHEYLQKNKVLDNEEMDAAEFLERRKQIGKITTGAPSFDKILFGGIETEAITEFYGEFGSGKSQMCHSLAVTVQLPKEKGGLNGGCIWLDTENTFRPERIVQNAIAKGIPDSEMEATLKRVKRIKIQNSSMLELAVKSLPEKIVQNGVKLIVIDSLMALHRAEFSGRGELYDRQHRINILMKRLIDIAETYKVAVVVTNQMTSAPDAGLFGVPMKPIGGNVVAHASTYRIWLLKGGKGSTIARIVDSPYHPQSDTRIIAKESGIEDYVEETKKKKAGDKDED